MLFQRQISSLPFMQWLWQTKENRRLLFWVTIVIAAQFAVFKFLYPFPNFMPPDSNSYMEAAWNNQFINMWAIGYSKFLRFVSSFSNSHFVLILLQYLLLQASILYLLFTIRYLLAPATWVFLVLLFANVLNPLVPHISNFVSTDALFTALSVTWFTQLLWILHGASKRLLLIHAFILLFAFMVRYNALYYPFISIIIIAFTDHSLKVKAASVGFTIFLLALFIGRTEYEYYKLTGKAQYSAFGGWQIASNALYGYAHSKQLPVSAVPERFQPLHAIVNRHMDSISRLSYRPDLDVAIYYLWDLKSPLRVYMAKEWRKDTASDFFKKWSSLAPLYADYGRYLIRKHPIQFLKYYAWPNTVKYYAPPTKFMGIYNMGQDSVEQIAASWFGWKNKKLSTYFKGKKIEVTEGFTIISGIINFVFVISFLSFVLLAGFSKSGFLSRRILWITISIWFCNMIFSVFAAPIELRYQLFPIFITFCFMLLLVSFVIQECMTKPTPIENREVSQPSDIEIHKQIEPSI
jgi:hypothetical protein